jgi:uncharacterized protein (DUF2062 family)
MEPALRICVVIPVYNHGLTVRRVAGGARKFFPVITVDDGSTDDTPSALDEEPGVTVVRLARNLGKGAALRAGFAKAEELGFTHAITMDADGQHSIDALEAFAALCQQHPNALILGVRDLKQAGAPWLRRASNDLSTFWFRFETGQRLGDTQCGYRCYPLAAIRPLRVCSGRYAFELEIMVKAAWAGLPLVACPIVADYAAPTSRLSHFHPWRDMAQVSWLHCRLATQAFCIPATLRKLTALNGFRELPWKQRVRAVLRHLFSEHTDTPGRLAAAVGIGTFCAMAPVWGFQTIVAVALAHRLRVNKAVALGASNLSAPPVAPFVLAAGLVIGHFLHTGQLVRFDRQSTAGQVSFYLAEWFVGSVVLAIGVGTLAALLTWLIGRLWRRGKLLRNHD